MPALVKLAIRLSIIYIPLLLIAMHGKPDKHPELTGKYEVTQIQVGHQVLHKSSCADSLLTVVYLDSRNACIFEFNALQRRWNGIYSLENDLLKITWHSPPGKSDFSGTIAHADSGRLTLRGTLGGDTIRMLLQKTE
jgi:hypothetical protein